MKTYLIIKDNIILRRYETKDGLDGVKASLKFEGIIDIDEIREVTSDNPLHQEEDLRHYDDDYKELDLKELVITGEIELKKEEKIKDNRIVKKSELELMQEGIIKPPKGNKVIKVEIDNIHAPDGLRLIPKNIDDLYNEGEMPEEDYYNFKLKNCHKNRQMAYEQEADPLFYKYQREEIPKQEWLDKIQEIKERFPKPTNK